MTKDYNIEEDYTRSKRCSLSRIILLIAVVLIGVAVILVIVYYATKDDSSDDRFPSDGSPLDFFDKDDALDIIWYHGANSLEQLDEALDGDYMMIEGDIQLRWYGYPNQTDEPIMAHPPDVDSDNTLDNWLDEILARDDKGAKLDFKSAEVVEPSLELLESKDDRVDHPVWVNADVVHGPGTDDPPVFDAEQFLEQVNRIYPEVTLSLGWTTGCCNEIYTEAMMEEMWEIAQTTTQPVSFPARAALFKRSWLGFKWLIEKDPERLTITVWTPSGQDDWEGATAFEMLYCRNDCHKKYIYYDLPGPKMEAFQLLCITAGSLFHHFPDMDARDGLYITWAHAVNSQKELDYALNSDVMMFEADVLLHGQDTENQTDVPIMAHPPDIYSDLTLEHFLDQVMETGKGMKLDFKSEEVLEPSLKMLGDRRGKFQQPVWVNADIMEGPKGGPGKNATLLKELVEEYFPECTLSIGWTTGWDNDDTDEVYTMEMMVEMHAYASQLQQPITYPVRASMAYGAWDELLWLLDQSRGYTLTIWSSTSDVFDPDELVYVREHSEIDRVFYDLHDELMEEFLDRLDQRGIRNGV